MKKFIYIMLFAIMTSTAVVSCTEEEVAPSTQNGGLSNTSDKKF